MLETRRLPRFRTILAGIALLLFPISNSYAKTVTFTGTMQTKLDFNRTYTITLPVSTRTLTLSIPLPQSGSLFGFAENAGQPEIISNFPATQESDITDPYGNNLHIMEYDNLPAGELTVHVNLAEMGLLADLDHSLPQEPFPVTSVPDDVASCLQPTEHVQSDSDAIRSLAQTITGTAKDEAGAAQAIAQWMIKNMTYDATGPIVRTPALTALEAHKARCDGWANLFIALARASGIPARYAGGYWISPQISYLGGAAIQHVASDHTHAWVELWFPDAGWVPYEPQQTIGFVDTHHLRVWQLPDSGAILKTLNFTCDCQTKPDIALKLISEFANLSDTVKLTKAATTDPDEPKNIFARK